MQASIKEITEPFADSRGPITVDRFGLELAHTINGLLIEPVAVLPSTEGDIVRPFKVGIGPEIKGRLKPDASGAQLTKAMHRYTRSIAYLLACAQADAMRHDMDGNPVEPVSELDRLSARQRFAKVLARVKQRRKARGDAKQGEGTDSVAPEAEVRLD